MELDIVPFQARLERLAYNNHVQIVQFADIEKENNEILKNYKRAMVIAQGFHENLMNILGNDIFEFHINLVKNHLTSVAYKVFHFLTIEGYNAFILPPMFLKSEDKYSNLNQLTARAAGIGNIGRKGFFVSPTFGVKIVLCSILTDAPLEYDNEYEIDLCKKCVICNENDLNNAVILCPYGKDKQTKG